MPFSSKGELMVDGNGRIAFASSYFCDLVGVDYTKVDGRSCFEFFFPDDMQEAKRLLGRLKSPNSEPFRVRLRRRDGQPLWVKMQGTALRVVEGDVYAISATVTVVDDKDEFELFWSS